MELFNLEWVLAFERSFGKLGKSLGFPFLVLFGFNSLNLGLTNLSLCARAEVDSVSRGRDRKETEQERKKGKANTTTLLGENPVRKSLRENEDKRKKEIKTGKAQLRLLRLHAQRYRGKTERGEWRKRRKTEEGRKKRF